MKTTYTIVCPVDQYVDVLSNLVSSLLKEKITLFNIICTRGIKACENKLEESLIKDNAKCCKDMIKKLCWCEKNCCVLECTPHYKPYGPWGKSKPKRHGVVIYNTVKNLMLVVQSSGYKWGPPKGGKEENETPIQTAIRELKEESGIVLTEKDLEKSEIVNYGAASFYIYETQKDILYGQIFANKNAYNDVTGIGYISLDCINERSKYWSCLTVHCQKIIKKITNKCQAPTLKSNYLQDNFQLVL